MTQTVEEKMQLAWTAVLTAAPFDASFLRSMEVALVPPEHKVKSAATDCDKYVWVNREFARTLDYKALAFVLCHEARHKVFTHVQRATAAGRHPMLDNIAADFIINNGLVEEGHQHTFVPITVKELIERANQPSPTGPRGGAPENRVLQDPWVPAHWGVQELYDYLAKRLPPMPPPSLLTGVLSGDALPTEGVDPVAGQLEIMVAYAAAKAHGRLPKGLDRVIEDLSKSRTDWRERIHTWSRCAVGSGPYATDWTYRRPSRRYVGHGPITPSLLRPPTGPIVVGVDTSGSIGSDELRVIQAEVRKMHEDIRPSVLHVVYCDADVAGVQTFGPDDTLVLKAKGAGERRFHLSSTGPRSTHVTRCTSCTSRTAMETSTSRPAPRPPSYGL